MLPALMLLCGAGVFDIADRPYRASVSGESVGKAVRIRVGTLALCVGVYLMVLSPYLMTSKRVFGQYFYNVNSTF